MFGEDLAHSADELGDLAAIEQRLDANSDFLDDREAEFVFRYAPA